MQWNKQLNAFFVQGRHLNVNVFITTQHVKGLGPMIRGNCDVAIMQPIYNIDARKELHNLFAGFMDKNQFMALMDAVVMSENLPGGTPKDPKLRVRTLVCLDFENTIDPSERFRWAEAEDPGEFRMLHPSYWKEQDNQLSDTASKNHTATYDPVEELDDLQAVQDSTVHF